MACPAEKAGRAHSLNSRLTKTTAKKPCFSKSGDTAAIPHATVGFIINSTFQYKKVVKIKFININPN